MESINLNLIPQGANPVVHAKQFDEGRGFRFNLFNGTAPIVLTGAETITCNVKKPDGNLVTVAVTNTSSNYVEVYTTLQMCACYGANLGEIRLEEDGNDIGTLNFTLSVEESPLNNGIESESSIHNLNTMVDEMVAEDVAEQYDSSNVIFDNEPTDNHGIGYTVTSEGIKTAIDNAFDYDNTASGSLVHITDGADNIPVKSLVSEIVAVQDLHGYDKPWVGGAGKNLLKPTQRNATASGVNYTVAADGKVTLSGTATDDNSFTIYSGQTLRDGGAYTCSLYGATNAKVNGRTSYTVTMAAGAIPSAFTITITNGTVYNESFFVQIEKGTTATNYEPYENICPITGFDNAVVTRCGKNLYKSGNVTEQFDGNFLTLGGTLGSNVPDGSLVLNAGTYTLSNFPTKEIRRYDESGARVNTAIGTMTFTLAKREKVKLTIVTNSQDYNVQIEIGGTATTFVPYNGNTYTFAFGQTVYGGHFDNKGNLVVTHSFIASYNGETINEPWVSSMDNYVPNTLPSAGAEVVYPLTTPIPLSITSQDIPTLLGENNIYSNCGDVEVNYYTNKSNDILEFIDSEIGKKNGTNIPIEENSQDSIKTYVNDEISSTKNYIDNGLNGKADKTELVKFFDLTASSTTSDSGISPFSYYGQITKTDSNIHNILAVSVIDTQFNNPSIAVFYGQSGSAYTFMVYSARSGDVKIRVAYN